MSLQKISIKTTNGTVEISRTDKVATITEERTCFGFKEKSVTTVTRLDDTCMHFAFGEEKHIIEQFKNQ